MAEKGFNLEEYMTGGVEKIVKHFIQNCLQHCRMVMC